MIELIISLASGALGGNASLMSVGIGGGVLMTLVGLVKNALNK